MLVVPPDILDPAVDLDEGEEVDGVPDAIPDATTDAVPDATSASQEDILK